MESNRHNPILQDLHERISLKKQIEQVKLNKLNMDIRRNEYRGDIYIPKYKEEDFLWDNVDKIAANFITCLRNPENCQFLHIFGHLTAFSTFSALVMYLGRDSKYEWNPYKKMPRTIRAIGIISGASNLGVTCIIFNYFNPKLQYDIIKNIAIATRWENLNFQKIGQFIENHGERIFNLGYRIFKKGE